MTTGLDTAKQLGSGAAAATIVRTIDAPLERVRIVLQNQNLATTNPYRGAWDALTRIPKEQGMAALWRGNFTNCLRVVPSHALRLTLFDHFQRLSMTLCGSESSRDLPLHGQVLSGSLSGFTTLLVVYPLDLARTQLSVNLGRKPQAKLVPLLRDIVRHQGVSGLYRGLFVGLLEITPYTGIALGGFEFLKSSVVSANESGHNLEKLACGWFSSLIASVLCYPLDTVKRQLMIDGTQKVPKYNRSLLTCMQTLFREGGVVPFYRGCLVNAMKSAPVAALTFVFNDMFRDFFGYSKTW